MNSILPDNELKNYISSKVLTSKSPLKKHMVGLKFNDYLTKSKQDRKEFQCLSQSEQYILNDKLQQYHHNEQEQRMQDLNQQRLPFDPPEQERSEKVNKQKSENTAALAYNVIKPQHYNKQQGKLITHSFEACIFSPDGYGKLAWDFLCMILIFYEITSIPYLISFDSELSAELGMFVDAAFMFDIVLTFNTAIYKKGVIQYSYKAIAVEYIKLWFWIDLAASFPYDYVIDAALTGDASTSLDAEVKKAQLAKSTQLLRLLKFFRFIKIVRLLRLAKLKVIFDKIDEFFQVSTTVITIVSFLRLSFFVLFWSHWLGCIFHFIGMNEDPENNWIQKAGIYYDTNTVRYINSIYWAVTTMITVGYGDISPQTEIERLFGIFFLLVACGVFSFTMNTIGNTMQQLSQKKDMYKKRITDINNYMNKVKIPKQLQNRVRRYLAYMWDSHRTVDLESITQNLSQTLKYELTIRVNGTLLAIYPLLCKTFSRLLLIEVTQILLEQTIQPDEYIFQEEDPNNSRNLYFIQEGTVNIVLMKTRQIVAKLSNKSIFGEINFFGNMDRTASAKSVNFTDVFYLKRSSMLKILQKYPLDYEKFQMICEEVNRQELSVIDIYCYACEMQGHVVRSCPSLHFIIDPYTFWRTRNRCLKAIMNDFVRADRTSWHPLRNLKQINKAAQQFQHILPAILFKAEEGTVEAQLESSIDLNQICRHVTFKSKFTEDRARKKKMVLMLRKQDKKLQQISNKQSELLQTTKLLSENILKEQLTAKYSSKIQFSDDSESETDKNNTNMQDILQEYGLYKDEIDKFNGNQSNFQKQTFTSLNDFEMGTDFELYLPHNNVSVVIKEINQYNQSKLCDGAIKPRIETDFDQHALQEFIEYYQIDFEEVKRFKLGVKKTQLKSQINFTQRTMLGLARQTKKQQNLLKLPKQNFKQLVNAVKMINIVKSSKQIQI